MEIEQTVLDGPAPTVRTAPVVSVDAPTSDIAVGPFPAARQLYKQPATHYMTSLQGSTR